jgi:uncharacterized protein
VRQRTVLALNPAPLLRPLRVAVSCAAGTATDTTLSAEGVYRYHSLNFFKECVMQNAINWFDIPVTDMARAMKFYETLTSKPLKLEDMGGAPGMEMAVFSTGSHEAVGGSLFKSPDHKPSEAGSVVYLNAAPSIDSWIARVKPAGGKVVTPKTALPEGQGYFAVFTDSEGNRVGLHAMA